MSGTPASLFPPSVIMPHVWAGLSVDHRRQAVTLLVQLAMQRIMAQGAPPCKPPGEEQDHGPRTDPSQDPV
jgi:hypothetical protein